MEHASFVLEDQIFVPGDEVIVTVSKLNGRRNAAHEVGPGLPSPKLMTFVTIFLNF
jgi:hypothetical protein